MTTLNRRIKRGTLGFKKNPLVIEYNNLYHIGKGLVFQIIKTYGDCKYSHELCKKIVEFKKNNICSGVRFNDIIITIGE